MMARGLLDLLNPSVKTETNPPMHSNAMEANPNTLKDNNEAISRVQWPLYASGHQELFMALLATSPSTTSGASNACQLESVLFFNSSER